MLIFSLGLKILLDVLEVLYLLYRLVVAKFGRKKFASRFISYSWNLYRTNTNWSFVPDQQQLILLNGTEKGIRRRN